MKLIEVTDTLKILKERIKHIVHKCDLIIDRCCEPKINVNYSKMA